MRHAPVLALLAALAAGSVSALAQSDDAEPGDTPAAEAAPQYPPVAVGDFKVTFLPDEPAQMCVYARTETAEGATVLVVPAYLTPDGAVAEAPRWLLAVGPLEETEVGTCYGLGGEPLE